jgi:Flp pilus assembly CpaE family ATPase
MAVLLEAVQARAEDDAAPAEERSRLAEFLKAAGGVGKDTLTELAAKVITSGL